MKILGLTGGIGMGKSTAAAILSARGVPVVDSDEIARQLVQPGESALAEICAVFGETIIAPNGHLRRDELARQVFAAPAARARLEAILHPRIRAAWQSQVGIWRSENEQLAVVVIPLLFETTAESFFDKIICVACSKPSQHQRLQARGWDEEQIQQRAAAQWPVEFKLARADFVVWTEGAPVVHQEQWQKILKMF